MFRKAEDTLNTRCVLDAFTDFTDDAHVVGCEYVFLFENNNGKFFVSVCLLELFIVLKVWIIIIKKDINMIKKFVIQGIIHKGGGKQEYRNQNKTVMFDKYVNNPVHACSKGGVCTGNIKSVSLF